MMYSKWNDPNYYRRATEELAASPVPKTPALAIKNGEVIRHWHVEHCPTSVEALRALLDEIDLAIIESVSVAKYLTSLQIFEYVVLRGFDENRIKIRKRINKMVIHRVIRESELMLPGADQGLRYCELDYFGFHLALEQGIQFHKGNCYVSYSKRMEKGIEDDTPCDVKRVLVGNQIVLGLLKSGAKMERFGIMETMRIVDPNHSIGDCIIRTAAIVHIDENSVLAYEVVRDTPESLAKIQDKVRRYYELINNKMYLLRNYHGDRSYPQMIICGESYEHNKKIAEYLRECGLWNMEDPILFTEDLLNIKNSLASIYRLKDDNSQIWYTLPRRMKGSKYIA